MSNLRTNYKDDVFSGSRKYRTVNNADGTVSFTDETDYAQNGDTYGAAQINQVNEIINDLDNNAYKSTDAAMTDIADNDYIPIYDTSASAKKKTLWSNIKTLLTQAYAIKVHDSNSAGTYGAGTSFRFGHVKLSDNYTSSAGNASQSIGASSQAAYNAYNTANTNSVNRYKEVVGELTANNRRIYMDYKNGRYGYNTSANRGADTFFPFKSGNLQFTLQGGGTAGHTINIPMTVLNDIGVTKVDWSGTGFLGEGGFFRVRIVDTSFDDFSTSGSHTFTNTELNLNKDFSCMISTTDMSSNGVLTVTFS